MSTNNTSYQPKPHTVANIDWAALLTKEDFENLAGFFDVLIEMDFEAKKRNERSKHAYVSPTNTVHQPQAD